MDNIPLSEPNVDGTCLVITQPVRTFGLYQSSFPIRHQFRRWLVGWLLFLFIIWGIQRPLKLHPSSDVFTSAWWLVRHHHHK